MTEFDIRHSAPIIRSLSIESSYPIYNDYAYRLRIGGEATHENLPIDALLVPGASDSKDLIVAFHGAINRRDVEIPRYEWLGQLAKRREHKLFISDTTLELANDLNLAWYLGTIKCDLISSIACFIEHVRKINSINKICLMGSSGGGFAALAIGARINNACSIAFSPQVNVWDFSEGHSRKFKEVIFEDGDWGDCQKAMENRTDLVRYYSEGRHYNSYIYYQNTGDIEHVKKHRKRFAEAQGVRLPDGRSFNQQGIFISNFDTDGHGRPPIEKMNELVNLAFDLATRSTNLIEDSTASGSLFDHRYNVNTLEIDNVPEKWLYYRSPYKASLPLASATLSFTKDGVPLRVFSSVEYDHPVLQAQLALKLLNNFTNPSLSDEERSSASDHARKTLHHLERYAVTFRSGIYFPFSFPWHQDNLQPPWYSAMAQGQVLQLACRYTELTGSREFTAFAERVFNSFLHLRTLSSDEIGVTHIDSEGYLWLEEYPYPEHNKFVLNGHIFAALGIYEYWRLTSSETAMKVFCGALSTVRRYTADFRNQNWSSHYDLRSRLLIRNYHSTHISLFEHLYALTGDTSFARSAEIFEDDFPNYQGRGTLRIDPGEHVGVIADNIRVPTKVIERKHFQLLEPMTIPFTVRTKMETEEGVWLLVEEDGPYKNTWFKEKERSAYPLGQIDRRNYNRPRRLISLTNHIKINGFDNDGKVVGETEINSPAGTVHEVVGKALWNGLWYALLKTSHPPSQSWYDISSKDALLV